MCFLRSSLSGLLMYLHSFPRTDSTMARYPTKPPERTPQSKTHFQGDGWPVLASAAVEPKRRSERGPTEFHPSCQMKMGTVINRATIAARMQRARATSSSPSFQLKRSQSSLKYDW